MISVLMPVYNVEKYLEKTLESVRDQTYRDFEVIMVDDGSSDASGAICDKWASEDSRFRVIHTPNRGVSAARNTALSEVRGDYIFFMDSDDLILPETFEELLDALIRNDADMSCGNILHIDDHGNPIDEENEKSVVRDEVLTNIEYLKKLSQENAGYYCHTTHNIYKKEVFNGIHFPEGKIHEDHARIHEIVYNCKKIIVSQKHYYLYVRHSAGITGKPFSPQNLDREEAFAGRIQFYLDRNLNDLAKDMAIYSLDAAIVNFTKCVKGSFYYGKTKDKIDRYIAYFLQHSPAFGTLSPFYKKVAIIGFVISHFPDVYAEYVNFFVKKDNMGLGEAFKDEVFEFIMKCFSCLPAKDRIVFESHPEMSCNAYPVYEYLLKKGLNEQYEFVWLSEDKSKCKPLNVRNLSFLNYTKFASSFPEKLKTMYTIATAKALVYTNQLLGEHGKGKISLCLQHGMPLKSSNGTYCIKNACTAAVCVSEFFAENYSKDFRVEKDKMIFTGFPRNDYLLQDNDSLAKFGFDSYDKVIFWLPTFRQRTAGALNKHVGDFEMECHGTGIPAIETKDDMQRVNEFCKENNCLLILKPHPVQDMSVVSEIGLSNFFLISDDLLREKGVQLYQLLGRCDAMITDYSSVYYDYLLTDKPIGLTIGDIAEYTAKRGFVYRDPTEILKGEVIRDTDDLLTFLQHVKDGKDETKADRMVVKNKIHTITDGSSAKRVGDWLIEQLQKTK